MAEKKTETKTETKTATASEETEEQPGEQKKASDALLVQETFSTLTGGPTQDDLNPAYAPPKDDSGDE